MKIVVCNVGSTSLKFQLLDMTNEHQIARGYIERVGEDDAIITFWVNEEKVFNSKEPVKSLRDAVKKSLDFLLDKKFELLNDITNIDGIGFKTIQAGKKNGSVILDSEVLQAMEDYSSLAPCS